jgi:hypothetical protein
MNKQIENLPSLLPIGLLRLFGAFETKNPKPESNVTATSSFGFVALPAFWRRSDRVSGLSEKRRER